MTPDYVAFHAAERSGAVALVDNGREITYPEFARDIRKITRALRDFALPRGAKVAIDCDDFYFHWLLRIGLERLGAVAASLSAADGPNSWPRFLSDFDLILSGRDPSPVSIPRHHQITPQWLEQALAGPDVADEPPPVHSLDDPIRIGYTSGTTGAPKRLVFSWRNRENSIAKAIWFDGFTRRSRNLVSMPLSMAGAYTNATACVRAAERSWSRAE